MSGGDFPIPPLPPKFPAPGGVIPEPPRSGRGPLLIAGVVVAVLLLCVGVACVGYNLVKPSASPQRVPVQPGAPTPTSTGGGRTPGTDAATGDGKQSGTQIATYQVTVVGGSVPLGDTPPTQAQFDPQCASGDVCLDGNFSSFDPVGTATKGYTLAGHVPPTYQGCKSTTLASSRIPVAVGQTFCLVKPGRVIGVSVTSVSHVAGGPVVFTTTVWADWPGSSPVALAPSPGPSAGTQLAAYPVTMNSGSVLLGDTPPSGPAFDPQCASGDLCVDGNFSSLDPVGIAVQAYTLAGNAPPTYPGCKATTLSTGRIPAQVGQTFCLVRPGRVIGGTVTATSPHAGGALTFTVTVWADPLP